MGDMMFKKKYKHGYDDYSVFCYPSINVRMDEPICSYHTVRWYRAFIWFMKYHKQYPKATIVLRHNKYF